MRAAERRRSRPPLLVMAFLMVFGVVSAVNTIHLLGRAVLDRAVRRATVVEGSLSLSFRGEAMVLRRETVLVAPASGVWQSAVQPGQRVRVGDKIGEVLNPDLLGRAQSMEAEAKMERARWESELLARLSRVEAELENVNAEISSTLRELRSGLQDPVDPSRSGRLEAGLKRLLERRDALLIEQAGLHEEKESGGSWRAKGAEAQELFQVAATPVTAPVPGVIFFTLDGWEEAFDPLQFQAALALAGPTGAVLSTPVANGESIAVGQLLAKLVQDDRTFFKLNIQDREAALLKPGEKVEVLLVEKGAYVPARVVASRQDAANSTVLLELLSSPPFLAERRTLDVEVTVKRLYGLLVPEKALVTEGAHQGVYLRDGDSWRFQMVEVLALRDGNALVTGLRSGDEIAVGWQP
jgi:putative membrane fusion protein